MESAPKIEAVATVEAVAAQPPERTALAPEKLATLHAKVAAALSPDARPLDAAFASSAESEKKSLLEARVARLTATVEKFSTMNSKGAKQLLETRKIELAEALAKLAELGGGEKLPTAVAEAAPAAANEAPNAIQQAEAVMKELMADPALKLDAEFASRQRLFAGAKTSDEKTKFAAHLLDFANKRAAAKQHTESVIASAEKTVATHAESKASKKPEPKTAEQAEDETTRAKRQRITELTANLKDVDLETYALRKQLQAKIGAVNPSELPPSLAVYASKVGKGNNNDDANFIAEAEAFLKTKEAAPAPAEKRAA